VSTPTVPPLSKRRLLSVILIAILVATFGNRARACTIVWYDEMSDQGEQWYAGVFGHWYCEDTETCAGGLRDLHAEIWTDKPCYSLTAG
jgi:hypothetical protein